MGVGVFNAVIIEDEKPSARRLNRMLEKQNVNVVASLSSVEESIFWFQKNPHPDVIFLDIQLSDGLSFEIFDVVDIKSACIFTTAYDEYALKAFKLNSIDYLLKPIDDEELETAIQKFEKNRSIVGDNINVQQFRNLMKQAFEPNFKTRFSIQVGQYLKLVEASEICFFYSENKGTYLSTFEGRNYLLDSSLEALEKEINPQEFFRVNRKCIVKLKAIKDIINYTNSRLELKLHVNPGFPLIVSREKVKDFKQWIG
ncbi:MAG TPA: LytTR family DNA-binding domain-containing protein [Salinimicrobium sp.]|nr:LytTR family DNA-binding domain-containing protein [Salinimicrobium sp.]